MKIAISATEASAQAAVDGRFGRCKHFMIHDTDTGQFTPVANEAQFATGGAGIQAAQTVQKAGAEVVLTGNVGPNAHKTLAAAGIKIYVGVGGSLQDAVRGYQAGAYGQADAPSVESHHGTS